MRNPCLFLNLLIASISVSCFPFSSSTPGQPSLSREQTVKTQIFLDSKGFGPGVVDGKPGEFTRKALAIYRQANSLPDNWTPPVESIEAFTRYTIASDDVSILGTMANEPADMAKLQRLPYETVLELLSERFHTTQTYLRQLNPGTDMENLAPGTTIIAPNVANPFRVHDYPSRYPAASSASAAQRQVIVDIQYRMLQVRQGSTILAAFPITPGSAEHPAPVGEWKIAGAVPYPWFRYDEGVLKRGERTETYYNLPPGPNSPVGILWAGLNRPGIGIHGSPTPDTIGRAGSHGCIRLSNWDAATFRTLVNKGTKVTIR